MTVSRELYSNNGTNCIYILTSILISMLFNNVLVMVERIGTTHSTVVNIMGQLGTGIPRYVDLNTHKHNLRKAVVKLI